MRRDPPAIVVAGRRVAIDLPPFVAAELAPGVSLDVCRQLVDAAAESGAHGVVVSEGLTPLDVVCQRAATRGLKTVARVASASGVMRASTLDVDAWCLDRASLEDMSLIRACARTGLPLILAGTAETTSSMRSAVIAARREGGRSVALIVTGSCVRGAEQLGTIERWAGEFELPVGFEDRGVDTFAWPLAVCLGASVYIRRIEVEGASVSGASTASALGSAVRDGRRAWAAVGPRVALRASQVDAPERRRRQPLVIKHVA